LPDKRDIGRRRREAAERGTDAQAALAALARDAKPIHPDQLYKAVKRFFTAATAAARREDSPHARAFSAVRPHWLGDTFVSHAVANGMSLESARNFAGHDSLDTTSVYATAELGRQYRESETFLRRRAPETGSGGRAKPLTGRRRPLPSIARPFYRMGRCPQKNSGTNVSRMPCDRRHCFCVADACASARVKSQTVGTARRKIRGTYRLVDKRLAIPRDSGSSGA
jgi:hypothetical protein